MSEIQVVRRIQIRASELGWRLFRNTLGFCECRGRKIRYGVANPGGSDLIGWCPMTITQDMVGKTIAQFIAREVKMPKGRVTKEQLRFLEAVNRAGGNGKIIRSPQEIP